jgi:ubiquinone/menaquinone biosynthesis C-methylase UbiE
MYGKIYDLFATPFEGPFGLKTMRRDLLSFAQGKTLEISAGTGFNFEYYPKGLEVVATEPHRSMREIATERAKVYPNISVESVEAEALPYPDESFDTVVATMALCSVDDPELALKEAYRVLKPQGKLLLIEHIRKDSLFAGKLLDLLTPGWRWLSGGCHLNRRPAQWIAKSKFRTEKKEAIWDGYGGLWVLLK